MDMHVSKHFYQSRKDRICGYGQQRWLKTLSVVPMDYAYEMSLQVIYVTEGAHDSPPFKGTRNLRVKYSEVNWCLNINSSQQDGGMFHPHNQRKV